MSEIKVGKNETLESALRRFKRSCQKAGVLSEVRKREHYEKPSVKRKKKSEAAKKRNRKSRQTFEYALPNSNSFSWRYRYSYYFPLFGKS